MLKFIPSFCYIEAITLTGKKIIAGDRATNSSIQVKGQDKENFIELYKMIHSGSYESIQELPQEKIAMALDLEKRGYFNENVQQAAMFNEYNHFARIFLKKEFNYVERKTRDNILINILCFLVLLLLTAFICLTPEIFSMQINYRNLNALEIVLSCTALPCLVFGIHELGHFIMAKILGIPVSTACAGLFIIYPTAFLTYRGININKTFNKITLLIGGAGGHIVGIFIGVILLRLGINNLILQMWILVNISMIYSNLIPFNISDGYFICSSLLGIFNLRLMGYRGINKWMHRQKPFALEKICGLIMITLWIVSFWGIYGATNMYIYYFGISKIIVYSIYPLFVISQIIRFIVKIYKLNDYQNKNLNRPVQEKST
jgi:hypothetical protein